MRRLAAVALAALAASICIPPIQLAATNVKRVGRLGNECASGKRKACRELAKIALGEKNTSARRVAVEWLTDQSLLARIAVEDEDASVRGGAVAKLTDQPTLAKIAVQEKDGGIPRKAVANLFDQSLLAKTALEAADPSVRSAAVAKLFDQSLLAKIAVEDKDGSVRSAAAAAANQLLRDVTEGRDIVDLLHERKIEVQAQGSGIQQVWVRIRRLVPFAVTVRIPVGTFFASSNPSAQNMVTTSESKVSLTNEQWQDVVPQAACANRPRHVPERGDAFRVERSPHQAELAKLMPVLDKARVDTKTEQAAVWIVTDNANYDDLGILVASPYGAAYRVINEQEAARAMRICEQAGIDITLKAIWKDRQRIISGLNDAGLKTWLEGGSPQAGDMSTPAPATTTATTDAAIHDAARNGDLATLSALLKDKPELVFSKDHNGGTPLHFAAGWGREDVVELLLANKAEVNAKANNGVTPLHIAAAQGHKTVAELLLAKGAEVNATADNGITPLHFAAGRGHKEVVELLLAKGAEVNAKASNGWTALYLAERAGHNDVANLLRQHGGHE